MDLVGEHFGFSAQRLVQVDDGQLFSLGDFLDDGDDAFGDGLFVDAPAVLVNGHRQAEVHLGFAGQAAKVRGEGAKVGFEIGGNLSINRPMLAALRRCQ